MQLGDARYQSAPAKASVKAELLAAILLMTIATRPAIANCYALTPAGNSQILVEARINGSPVAAILDSAAEATILDRHVAQRLHLTSGQTVAGHGSGQDAFDATLVNGVTL